MYPGSFNHVIKKATKVKKQVTIVIPVYPEGIVGKKNVPKLKNPIIYKLAKTKTYYNEGS